jgi:streptogramin lyase/fibronectin type 3 domain-containing protein
MVRNFEGEHMKLKKRSIVLFTKRSVLITSGVLLAAVSLTVTKPALADPGMAALTDYATPTTNAGPTYIVAAPNGMSYFSESNAGQIGQINQSGHITEYSLPSNDASTTPFPLGLALGSNPGEVIYTDNANNAIGDLDTTTGTATLHSIPTAQAGPGSIAADCNGNYWFTEGGIFKIGRLDSDGTIDQFTLPGGRSNHPTNITAGPNSGPGCNENMWFTDGSNKIGEINQNGTVTDYTVPGTAIYPEGITTGPDGALWFTGDDNQNGANIIGRLTTTGDFSLFPLSDTDTAPNEITTGPDGALWFTNAGGSDEPLLGRITTAGEVTNYTTPNADPFGVAWDGVSNSLSFTEDDSSYVGLASIPSAGPTNLIASSSASAPELSWTGVSGASAYNIYRDGVEIDSVSSTDTSYADNSAMAGNTYSYFITATINGTESEASNSVSTSVYQTAMITSASSTTASAGAPLNFQVATTGTPTPSLSETGTLPSGVTFTDNGDGTASLSGTPVDGSNGNYPLTISANNSVGSPATQAFTLSINNTASAPGFNSASSDTETYGVPFSFTVTTNGNPAPAITKTGSLPKDISFTDNGNGTATIAGTPSASTDMGVYNLTLKAKNSLGTATQAFTFTITKSPIIKNIPNKTAYVGTPFTMTIKSTGYYTPSLTEDNQLPSGLSLTDNGNGTATIAGTPQTFSGNVYPLQIDASNQLGSTSQQFNLTVDEGPTFSSADNTNATVGSSFNFQVIVNGYPNPTIKEIGKLPKGITFKNGTFSGTAASESAGTYSLTLTAKNATGSATQSFTLTVS